MKYWLNFIKMKFKRSENLYFYCVNHNNENNVAIVDKKALFLMKKHKFT
jgi:hypothetical protein